MSGSSAVAAACPTGVATAVKVVMPVISVVVPAADIHIAVVRAVTTIVVADIAAAVSVTGSGDTPTGDQRHPCDQSGQTKA
jgi:hypothetical protein